MDFRYPENSDLKKPSQKKIVIVSDDPYQADDSSSSTGTLSEEIETPVQREMERRRLLLEQQLETQRKE